MSGSLYEGYKDALRRGHVAAVRGRHDLAIAAYREAARIAPDRALPYVGLGGALAKLGRSDEALSAYRAALDRAPDDEGALRGRADVLAAQGNAAEAASTLDRLAGVLEAVDRLADACDVARRALELAESRGRRRQVQALVGRLRESGDPSAAEALDRAMGVLEIDRLAAREPPPAAPEPPPAAPEPPPAAPEPPPAVPEPRPAAPEHPAAGPEPSPSTPEPAPRRVPPPDPAILARAFESAVDARDFQAARKQAVASASAYRAVGQLHAAIDACYEALAIAPADPGIHFALAELYFERGWRGLAADKLVLIGRLAQLTGDAPSMARLCDLVVRRFPEDARLVALCA